MLQYLDPIPAYVYKIICLWSGEYYFGWRAKHIRLQRLPEEDLWIRYYSSSTTIQNLLKDHPKENFRAEIVATHIDPNAAYWIEQDMIKDHIHDPLCLNKHYIDRSANQTKFNTFGVPSPLRGRPSPLIGVKKGPSKLTGRPRLEFKGRPSGRKGERWWTNGVQEVRAKVQPQGFELGRITTGRPSPCKGKTYGPNKVPSPLKGIPTGRKGIPNLKNKGKIPASAGKPNPYKGKSTALKGRKFPSAACEYCGHILSVSKMTYHLNRCLTKLACS